MSEFIKGPDDLISVGGDDYLEKFCLVFYKLSH